MNYLPQPATPALDPRMEMIHALAQQGQPGPQAIDPHMARAQSVGQLHQVAAALAANMVRQKSPLGTARVAPIPFPQQQPSMVDGGYSGAGVRDAHGNLVARQGFNHAPVPPVPDFGQPQPGQGGGVQEAMMYQPNRVDPGPPIQHHIDSLRDYLTKLMYMHPENAGTYKINPAAYRHG